MRYCGHLTAVGKKCVKAISEPSWWCGMQRHPPNPPNHISFEIGYLATMFWLDDCTEYLHDWDELDRGEKTLLVDAARRQLFACGLLARTIGLAEGDIRASVDRLESICRGRKLPPDVIEDALRQVPLKTPEAVSRAAEEFFSDSLSASLALEAFGVGLFTTGKHSNLHLWAEDTINDVPLRALLHHSGALPVDYSKI